MDKYDALPRFNSYTKDEWRSVVRLVRPDWTDEQFNAEWDFYQQRKATRLTCGGSC
jgi:hypothetical protein